MVYIGADGSVKEKRSSFRLSIITDLLSAFIGGILLFLKTVTAGPDAIAAVSSRTFIGLAITTANTGLAFFDKRFFFSV